MRCILFLLFLVLAFGGSSKPKPAPKIAVHAAPRVALKKPTIYMPHESGHASPASAAELKEAPPRIKRSTVRMPVSQHARHVDPQKFKESLIAARKAIRERHDAEEAKRIAALKKH